MLFNIATPLLMTVLSGALALAIGYGAFTHPGPPASEQERPLTVDLRPQFRKWDLEPRRQGSRGTCSVFAVGGALEYAVASNRRSGTRLSIEFLNWAGHRAANRTEDGGFFSELWKGYETFGVCTENDLPYQSQYDAALQPPASAVEDAMRLRDLPLHMHWIKEWDPKTGLTQEQLDAIKQTLRKHWPVCGGFRWPKQAHWEQDVLQMCPPDQVFDGHSVLLIGYRNDTAQPGGGVFLIRNSGGDGHDGYLPYAYVSAYMNDAIWIESTHRSAPERKKLLKG